MDSRKILSLVALLMVSGGQTHEARSATPSLSDGEAEVIAAALAGTTPATVSPIPLSPPTQTEQDLTSAYYASAKYSYENRTDAFKWQAVTTKIIFVVVILLVLFGATLTALQFTRNSTSVTALKASTGGVEITSPVIGLVILSLSLGFFYLYLANVYPIRELRNPGAEQLRVPAP